MEIWKGKKKAFTLSYDDGVESDIKLLDIINKYGLKGTFNLNSELIGDKGTWDFNGYKVRRLGKEEMQGLYKGHEIALHGCKHLNPTELSAEELHYEMAEDKAKLEKIFDQKIVGAAYAYGAYNDKVAEELRADGIFYARTVHSSHNFKLQENLLEFYPTCHHDDEELFALLEEFIAYEGEEPALFYLWGHSYEFDGNRNWDRLEEICKKVSGREDIFYAANQEALGAK